MDWQFKKHAHAPAHLLANHQLYFITGSTLYGRPYMTLDGAKAAFLSILEDFLARKNWQLDHWEILDDHYHITTVSSLGEDLPLIIGNVHRKSAKEIRNKTTLKVKGKIWHNYWDRCIRDEDQYYNCLRSMYWNPVKHGYTTDPAKYKWSSFYRFLQNGGDFEELIFLQDRVDKLPFFPGDL
ncbi:MAG: transposase [Ignavibacteriales bacterium]|nr:transposase [Ignavibacteriales bacterium]